MRFKHTRIGLLLIKIYRLLQLCLMARLAFCSCSKLVGTVSSRRIIVDDVDYSCPLSEEIWTPSPLCTHIALNQGFGPVIHGVTHVSYIYQNYERACVLLLFPTGTTRRNMCRLASRAGYRYVALTYAAACLGFMAQIILFSPREDPPNSTDNVVLAFLSSEVCREAGGVFMMAQAMVHCAFTGRPLKRSSKISMGGKVVRVACVAVSIAAIFLGFFLPGYLERTGIVVPAHCGGG